MTLSTAKIIDFNIEIVENAALTASILLQISDRSVKFGGASLYASLPSEVSSNFFSHFIFRCMQTTGSNKIMQMYGQGVQVMMDADCIVGICNLEGNDWFYPAAEFEKMEKRDDDIKLFGIYPNNLINRVMGEN